MIESLSVSFSSLISDVAVIRSSSMVSIDLLILPNSSLLSIPMRASRSPSTTFFITLSMCDSGALKDLMMSMVEDITKMITRASPPIAMLLMASISVVKISAINKITNNRQLNAVNARILFFSFISLNMAIYLIVISLVGLNRNIYIILN